MVSEVADEKITGSLLQSYLEDSKDATVAIHNLAATHVTRTQQIDSELPQGKSFISPLRAYSDGCGDAITAMEDLAATYADQDH